MSQQEEAADITAGAAERIEGVARKAKEHAEAGRLLEAMACLALVEYDARQSAEWLAYWLRAEEDLMCVRAAILADVHGVVNS